MNEWPPLSPSGWVDRLYLPAGKRLLDLLIGGVGVIFLGLVFVPVALAILLDSKGPIFFVQERAGLHECPFRMVKFRTMKWPPVLENSSKPAHEDDERLTRVGRLLRRSSLDELPQFWHVLWGEMSFIGPRPELMGRLALYTAPDRQRAAVKPGMSGWWQVHGRPQPMQEHAHLDSYYIQHISFGLDMQILFRTVIAVLRGTGAV
ncbi:MAG: sugar transferase [Caldilineaceae bacterium]|nr:sugar transferase [Caldilineaceae bacterium]